MSERISRAVLVTGCSTGIGRATALRLAAAGYTVYATARKQAAVADLVAKGCKTLALDGAALRGEGLRRGCDRGGAGAHQDAVR